MTSPAYALAMSAPDEHNSMIVRLARPRALIRLEPLPSNGLRIRIIAQEPALQRELAERREDLIEEICDYGQQAGLIEHAPQRCEVSEVTALVAGVLLAVDVLQDPLWIAPFRTVDLSLLRGREAHALVAAYCARVDELDAMETEDECTFAETGATDSAPPSLPPAGSVLIDYETSEDYELFHDPDTQPDDYREWQVLLATAAATGKHTVRVLDGSSYLRWLGKTTQTISLQTQLAFLIETGSGITNLKAQSTRPPQLRRAG